MRDLIPYIRPSLMSASLFDEVDRMFDGLRAYDERAFSPACEVYETDDHFTMSFDLPGMKKEDIKIEMTSNTLVISGERKRTAQTEAQGKIQRFDRSYGFFKRSFTLPVTVDADGVEAVYTDGVLELLLPKAQSAKTKKIEIRASKPGFLGKLLGDKAAVNISGEEKTS